MKKLFTLAAAVLASFSLWAVDPTLTIGTDAQTTATFLKEYATEGLTLSSSASWSSGAVQIGNTASAYNQHYLEVLSASDYIDSISFLISGNGSNKSIQAPVFAWATTATGNTADTYDILDPVTVTANAYASAKWFTYDLSKVSVKCARIYRTTKGISSTKPEYTGSASEALGSGQTIKIYGLKIWTTASCADPEFTVPAGGTGFVGDPINLAITSKNNSKPVDYAVTVDGVEGEIGTDYSFNVSPGLVQATPLKAGTFEITFSQASDGTYCDAEKSATFVISEKTPVTSFKVDGPTKAHIGEEVTLTATDFDAAPTEISWLQLDIYEIVGNKASYTFTSNVAGTIEFYALARNNFNNPDDQADDYQVAKYHAVTFAVGTDATLSDLKVNGATIDGFAADKFEYNLGELGVYDALKVEATAADAPYASAAVVDNGEGKVTVTVTAEDESTQDYVINYTRKEATALAPISTSTTWDWTKAGDVQTSALSGTTTPKQSDEINFADVLTNYDASFNAAALVGKVQWYNRQESTNLYTQGNYWKFNTSVPGKLVITYSGTNTTARELRVNEVKVGEYNSNKPQTSGEINITAGEVTIAAYQDEAASMARIYKLVFTADGATAIDNTEAEVKAVKMVENGMLIIKKDGKKYNIIGSVIR